jgi:hypothetical protein
MERRGAQPETTEIARALVSMVFPCQKDELIRHAEACQADAAVLAVLESMPEGTYASMADVIERFEQRAGSTAARGPGMSPEGQSVTAQRHKTMARARGWPCADRPETTRQSLRTRTRSWTTQGCPRGAGRGRLDALPQASKTSVPEEARRRTTTQTRAC